MNDKKVRVIKVIKKGTIQEKENETKVSSSEFIPKKLQRKVLSHQEWEKDKAARLHQESEARKREAIRLLFGD